ncbi:tRNA (adenosine(37)-N6)-threonylcarbamoyltransferase complex dimerization subunit type 1 TsaB [Candidatus Margulisiibacteriota bacterium]
MNILAIQTAEKPHFCVVSVDGNIFAHEIKDQKGDEYLVDLIGQLLHKAGILVSDIDLFGVVVGPGAYTGLRIGIMTAKAFALLKNKPLVGIPTLQFLGYQIFKKHDLNNFYVLQHARSDLFNTSHIKMKDGIPHVVEKGVKQESLLKEYVGKEKSYVLNKSETFLPKLLPEFVEMLYEKNKDHYASVHSCQVEYWHEPNIRYSSKPELRRLREEKS